MLVAGAVIGSGGTIVTTTFTQRTSTKQAAKNKREDQTRAALQSSVASLQQLYDAQQRGSVPPELLEAAVIQLRKDALLVHVDELRKRLEVARQALEWPDGIYYNGPLKGTGLHYLIRYLYDEVSVAAGAYLRLEPVPTETMQFVGVRDSLAAAYARPEQC